MLCEWCGDCEIVSRKEKVRVVPECEEEIIIKVSERVVINRERVNCKLSPHLIKLFSI